MSVMTQGLLDEPTEPRQEGRGIDCAKFAGQRRDHGAFLFRTGRGYCDDERHPGSIWNVEQNILKRKPCPYFEEADDHIKAQRQRAVEFYGVRTR